MNIEEMPWYRENMNVVEKEGATKQTKKKKKKKKKRR